MLYFVKVIHLNFEYKINKLKYKKKTSLKFNEYEFHTYQEHS